MSKHEEAMAWLNIRFCLTQDKSEEKNNKLYSTNA